MANTNTERHTLENEQISQVRRIPRTKIRRFADQPRTYFDARDMGDLAASIEEIGQQTPIVVKIITGDSKHSFELVDGERRWIACGMAGVDTMLAWVRPIADTDEQFIASVVGNFGRSDHTALEISQAVDRIRKSKRMQELSAGEQVARIAKIFARSEPWVYSHLAILRLHPEVQAMMAPTIPEEERLSHTLGVFISSLHHDIQLKIAKVVLAKKMSVNGARLYARQVAEEQGVKAGASRTNSAGQPSQSWRRLATTIRLTEERLDVLLVPATQDALKKRDPAERAVMVAELERCINRLSQLKTSLVETSLAPEVEKPRPASMPTPTATVVDIRSIRLNAEAPAKPFAVVPPPRSVPPPPPPTPPPSSVSQNGDQTWDLSTRVLAALFYSGGRRKVNLSESELEETLCDFLPKGADIGKVICNALNAARSRWRVPPKGDDTEKHFTRLVTQFRRDYGDAKDIDDAFSVAVKEDRSGDPVAL